MDNRRWNTGQVIAGGILNIKPPASDRPSGVDLALVEEGEWSEESLRTGLENGGLNASMYYGCWSIWKTENGYSGELMQYRAVTGKFQGYSLEDALEKAEEWASGCEG